MITDAQYAAWLRNPRAARVTLVEADYRLAGVLYTEYMSIEGYTSLITDTPANLHYAPIVKVGVEYVSSLSITSSATLSIGDLSVSNANGVRESWFDRIWTNCEMRMFIGDPTWSRADFRRVFTGVMAPIARKDMTTIALRMGDKMRRLNGPLTEVKLPSGTLSSDSVYPLCFGECHNVTPVFDPSTQRYYVHDGAIESVIEVRVSGLPVEFTPDVAGGYFTLNVAASGPVTCDVQGDKFGGVYRETVATLIERIVTGYGKAIDRFTTADIDTANFSAFDLAHPDPVGIYVSDRANVAVVCQALASSVGAQLLPTGLGLLKLVQIDIPASGPATDIKEHQMLHNSLVPVASHDPLAAVKVGYCKNWTVQNNLMTALPAEHASLVAREWLTVTAESTTIKTDHRLSVEPPQTTTMLVDTPEANTEAARLLALWGPGRTEYEFVGRADALLLNTGDIATIYSSDYGMESGVRGIILSLAPDWDNYYVKGRILV